MKGNSAAQQKQFGAGGKRASPVETAARSLADLPPPLVDGDARAHDAWAAEYSHRSFALRMARLDASIAAARVALVGATVRSLPGRGLGLLGALMLGDWLRGEAGH